MYRISNQDQFDLDQVLRSHSTQILIAIKFLMLKRNFYHYYRHITWTRSDLNELENGFIYTSVTRIG
jgi:hypothetical protein